MGETMLENRTVVGLGFFDGLHIGHMELIKRVKNFSQLMKLRSIIYTFDTHPNVVLSNVQSSKLLMSNKRKMEIIQSEGIDSVYFEWFTQSLANMEPREFVEKILLEKFNVAHVVVGFNYNFGAKGSGDSDLLIKLGNELGFSVEVVPSVYCDGEIVSSTSIRRLIELGDVVRVARLLGRPFEICGIVKTGRKLGSRMNFPTANIYPTANFITPLNGVYATRVVIDGEHFMGVTNVGTNPTVTSEINTKVETHLLDYQKDIYGKEIIVEFIELIRVEEKFKNIEELFSQIAKDSQKARVILNGK